MTDTYDAYPQEPIPSRHAVGMIQSMLMPGENLLHVATISRGIYWKGWVMLALGLIALQYSYVLASYLFVVAGGLLILSFTTKKFLLLATTDQRVIIRAGVFNVDRIDLRHSKIESLELMYTPPGMIFGYGSIILSGTGRSRLMIPFIKDAATFRDHLAQKLMEREIPLPSTPYAPPPPPPPRFNHPGPYAAI